MAYLVFATRVALGVLLLVAGTLKAHEGPAATATSIAGYRILAPALVAPLAVALPYVEIALGAYLAAGLFTSVVAWIATAAFLAFAGAVASLVVRAIPADCGCFSSAIPTPPSWGHVALDVVLALLAAGVATAAPGAFSLDERFFSSAPTGGALDSRREA